MTGGSAPRHPNLGDEVAVEQARLLFRDSGVGVAVSVALAVVLAIIFYPHLGASPLGVWLAALMASIGLRLIVLHQARAAELAPDKVPALVRRVIVATFFTGAAWGALILVAYPQVPGSLQFLFALVIVGMLAGAVAVYAVSFATWLAFCVPIVVATMVMLFRSTDPESGRLFILMGSFAMIVAIMAYRSAQVLRASLRLGRENRGLVRRLTLARDNAENLYRQNLAAYARLEHAEALLRDEAQVLRMLAEARPIGEILASIEEITRRRLSGRVRCEILVNSAPPAGDRGDAPAMAVDHPIHDHMMREVGVLRIEQVAAGGDAGEEHDFLQRMTRYAGIAIERDGANRVLERQARAMDSAANAIFVLEKTGNEQQIVYANPAAGRLTGRASEQLVGANLSAVLRFHDKTPRPAMYGPYDMEREVVLRGRRADGAEFWAEPAVAAVSAGPGGAAQSVMVLNDITARMTAEQALRELSNHLQTVREEEMSRIAREVHDEIGSLLTGLKMDLGWVRQRVASRDPLLAEKYQAMMRLADSTLDATRRIATGLRPLVLDHLGIGAAIEDYASGFRARTGIACDVEVALGDTQPDAAQAIALFRMVQEGLTNVARHARARDVNVRLLLHGETFILTIADDGVGIGHLADGMPRAALGLRGMRERAYALGGELTVKRGANGGTILAAYIPTSHPISVEGEANDQNINRG